ncbi:unnamed protein product [Amoebophrya sp. A120]|nr:unnamed protein product [Amoebophrya sp. A120]|eukprot:GSA120T00020930001.1
MKADSGVMSSTSRSAAFPQRQPGVGSNKRGISSGASSTSGITPFMSSPMAATDEDGGLSRRGPEGLPPRRPSIRGRINLPPSVRNLLNSGAGVNHAKANGTNNAQPPKARAFSLGYTSGHHVEKKSATTSSGAINISTAAATATKTTKAPPSSTTATIKKNNNELHQKHTSHQHHNKHHPQKSAGRSSSVMKFFCKLIALQSLSVPLAALSGFAFHFFYLDYQLGTYVRDIAEALKKTEYSPILDDPEPNTPQSEFVKSLRACRDLGRRNNLDVEHMQEDVKMLLTALGEMQAILQERFPDLISNDSELYEKLANFAQIQNRRVRQRSKTLLSSGRLGPREEVVEDHDQQNEAGNISASVRRDVLGNLQGGAEDLSDDVEELIVDLNLPPEVESEVLFHSISDQLQRSDILDDQTNQQEATASEDEDEHDEQEAGQGATSAEGGGGTAGNDRDGRQQIINSSSENNNNHFLEAETGSTPSEPTSHLPARMGEAGGGRHNGMRRASSFPADLHRRASHAVIGGASGAAGGGGVPGVGQLQSSETGSNTRRFTPPAYGTVPRPDSFPLLGRSTAGGRVVEDQHVPFAGTTPSNETQMLLLTNVVNNANHGLQFDGRADVGSRPQ